MSRARWGIVGTGRISATTVGDLHLTENVDLVAVASRTAANAEAFAAEHEVPRCVRRLRRAVRRRGRRRRLPRARRSARTPSWPAGRSLAGKHVLVEKAFTTTAAEARELAALAAERGRFLMEAMWMGFNPAIRRLLDEVAAGAIGDVRTVQAGFGFPSPPDAIIWRPELGGGALLDLGVYPLTLAQLCSGGPTACEAIGGDAGRRARRHRVGLPAVRRGPVRARAHLGGRASVGAVATRRRHEGHRHPRRRRST